MNSFLHISVGKLFNRHLVRFLFAALGESEQATPHYPMHCGYTLLPRPPVHRRVARKRLASLVPLARRPLQPHEIIQKVGQIVREVSQW